ncbi:hypothetical protein F4859DRAFT_525813 [Xylaria cf. heliscus]|nr:hypothetical protein F4859DRAFT_525813 [Xylaria cf. heliscus]
MSSLMVLPPEVLEMIVDLLVHSSTPYTIRSLASVNRILRSIVQYSQHRVLHIPDTSEDDPLHHYFHALETQDLLRAVRTIEFGSKGFDQFSEGSWKALCKYVPEVKDLRNIHVPIGPSLYTPLIELLGILRSHMPRVWVHARSRSTNLGLRRLRVFQDFSNVCSLELIAFKSREIKGNTEIVRLLEAILTTCPNLRILRIHTRTLEVVCLMKYDFFCPKHANVGHPQLEILDIQDTQLWPIRSLSHTLWEYTTGEPPTRLGTLPGRLVDWSKLRHLRIKEVALLQYITAKLTGLKSFEAPNVLPDDCLLIRRFFLVLPSLLERIKLPNWTFLPLTGLMKYTSTLRALHFTHS